MKEISDEQRNNTDADAVAAENAAHAQAESVLLLNRREIRLSTMTVIRIASARQPKVMAREIFMAYEVV
jgi:hypothetical protein